MTEILEEPRQGIWEPLPGGLARALAAFQAELPPVAKTKTAKVRGETPKGVPFNYEYKYADLADVSETVMPLLGKHGLAFTCQPTTRNDGAWFGLAYQLLHVSGERIEGWFPLDPTKKMQVIGGDITYARRYCLSAVTGVAAEEDTDAQGSDLQPETPAGGRSRRSAPERAAGNLPRNTDGSVSRSRSTDAELAATGQMTDQQLRDHNRLERDTKGTGPQGTQRLTETPIDDPFYLPAHNHPTGPDDPTPLWGECPGCMAGSDRTPPVRAPRASNVAGVIHGEFKRLGFDDKPREARLGVMTAITGRTITSTNDLTAAEGLAVKRLISACRDEGVLAAKLLELQQEAPDA